MKKERIHRVPRQETEPEVVEDVPTPEVAVDADLLTDVDALLDEIDSLLEDQSVLCGFRQRSGQ